MAYLAANLRESDADELRACGIANPFEAIDSSVKRSLLCWAGTVDGELCCLMGVTTLDLLAGHGSPWMLGTPALNRHSRILVRLTPDYISRMLRVFPLLTNHVHAKNTTSVRWLRRVGFTLDEPAPFGPFGEMFHRFEMRDDTGRC